jgi:hypothetical protein
MEAEAGRKKRETAMNKADIPDFLSEDVLREQAKARREKIESGETKREPVPGRDYESLDPAMTAAYNLRKPAGLPPVTGEDVSARPRPEDKDLLKAAFPGRAEQIDYFRINNVGDAAIFKRYSGLYNKVLLSGVSQKGADDYFGITPESQVKTLRMILDAEVDTLAKVNVNRTREEVERML